ncbi:CueP family metal-binding protein [Kocuria marina]|uniref:CueP family metal-binding protein n=1 Tax=Kocuria marina TaxID=223184 RepID=UPI0034608C72
MDCVKRELIVAGALLLALAGCTAAPQAQPVATSTTATTSESGFLADHDLAGLDAVQIIDHLDQVPVAERPTELMASVRADHLLLSDTEQELNLPLPEDRFYLSLAPYLDQTHECHYHSLTTCRGELANEQITVRITDDATGQTLIEEQVTTFNNGFAGFWLPRGITGTIEVTYDGHTGQSTFSASDEAATCLTTLQLT